VIRATGGVRIAQFHGAAQLLGREPELLETIVCGLAGDRGRGNRHAVSLSGDCSDSEPSNEVLESEH
jgi:hypothetical protein